MDHQIRISTHLQGLKDTQREISELFIALSSNFERDSKIGLDLIAKDAFDKEYNSTPFINATGNYYRSVQFIQDNEGIRVEANVPYADCLEVGHGSFDGYHIMERTTKTIEKEASQLSCYYKISLPI